MEQIVITPHEKQALVLTSQKRFILAVAGIQGGKTFIGCVWLQLQIQAHPTKNHLVCALSQDQLNNVVIAKFFDQFPMYREFYVKKDKTVYIPTGGKIFFRSLEDPKYVEGITAHSAWIDEADLCGYKGYLIVRGRLGATGGKLLMTSSIAAEGSWLMEYKDKFDPASFDFINWKSGDNPNFSREELEALRLELDPSLFRRRYEADMDYDNGKVYGGFSTQDHIVDAVPQNDPIEKAFIGIDWGWNDPTAIIVVGLSMKKNIYILADFSLDKAPIELIVTAINKFKTKFKVRLIYADPQNKSMLESVKIKIRHDIQPGNRNIFSGTSLIRNLIYQNRFYVLKNCTHVLREIRTYSFVRGLVSISEEPEDANNHTLDAIRYVLATYPLPSVRYTKKEEEERPSDFWIRRTPAYVKAKASEEYTRSVDREEMYIP